MAGVYGRWILPRLLDLSMRNRLLDHYRQRAIETARGLVLEVGVGSGLNLPLYSQAVDRVCGIDLSPELIRLARRRDADALIPVSLLRASAEHLPFADAVFDTVVMTWTLCSIANPVAALIEMRRVLKPGGQLLFVEHGLSPEIGIARWQHWLTPCWDRRWLPSRSQDGRLDPRCGVPNQCSRNRLYEGAETLDFHVSGFSEKLTLRNS
jgi:ubiquinone/menaquinone biosynthesis C-methylase UbiE